MTGTTYYNLNLPAHGDTNWDTPVNANFTSIDNILYGKVDKADLTTCHVIVETYISGTSWYRVWDDGWIEQGGRVPTSNNDVNVSVSLIKTFSNTNYYINLTSNTTDNTFNKAQPNWVNARTTTGFTAHVDCYGAGTHDWYACGY